MQYLLSYFALFLLIDWYLPINKHARAFSNVPALKTALIASLDIQLMSIAACRPQQPSQYRQSAYQLRKGHHQQLHDHLLQAIWRSLGRRGCDCVDGNSGKRRTKPARGPSINGRQQAVHNGEKKKRWGRCTASFVLSYSSRCWRRRCGRLCVGNRRSGKLVNSSRKSKCQFFCYQIDLLSVLLRLHWLIAQETRTTDRACTSLADHLTVITDATIDVWILAAFYSSVIFFCTADTSTVISSTSIRSPKAMAPGTDSSK